MSKTEERFKRKIKKIIDGWGYKHSIYMVDQIKLFWVDLYIDKEQKRKPPTIETINKYGENNLQYVITGIGETKVLAYKDLLRKVEIISEKIDYLMEIKKQK